MDAFISQSPSYFYLCFKINLWSDYFRHVYNTLWAHPYLHPQLSLSQNSFLFLLVFPITLLGLEFCFCFGTQWVRQGHSYEHGCECICCGPESSLAISFELGSFTEPRAYIVCKLVDQRAPKVFLSLAGVVGTWSATGFFMNGGVRFRFLCWCGKCFVHWALPRSQSYLGFLWLYSLDISPCTLIFFILVRNHRVNLKAFLSSSHFVSFKINQYLTSW